jgi:hydrogenase maturation protein HypF
MKAIKITINGIVQGVGFRPYIYRLAQRHQLTGWVLNSSRGVQIRAQGSPSEVDAFLDAIPRELPPQAVIDRLAYDSVDPEESRTFTIKESLEEEGATRISPDISICEDCLRETMDPDDRRHLYPFTNCTNCGPRFSIIRDTPYDRPLTTMSGFTMCPECRREYDDPGDRRFHAQPNACPACGPRVWLCKNDGARMDQDHEAVKKTAELLLSGGIAAIKGIGGFHLACDAANEGAVQKLRDRKQRPHKPLALMCADLEDVEKIAEASAEEARVLQSSPAPIVLLRKIKDQRSKISGLIAPGNDYLGVMLAHAPVHHLLFRELKRISSDLLALVMTSGNIQDEPVIIDNDQAVQKLAGIADHFLMNDRGIENRNDDSIVFIGQESKTTDQKQTGPDIPASGIQIVRHSRGYAPNPINLPFEVAPTLAVGGEMKNVFCLAAGDRAYVSQHIGEMDNAATLEFFGEMAAKYRRWFKIDPEIIAHDLHPDYLSTRWAREQKGVSLSAGQHHQAHLMSVLADNGRMEPCIGVAFDGTGYGQDGRIWGGEFLVFDGQRIERAGHLEYLPLPGGEASIKKPYRIAAAYGRYLTGLVPESLRSGIDPRELEVITKQVESGFNLAWTSSLGRLFDAVSALLGICRTISFEAQAAMALENAAEAGVSGGYGHEIIEQEGRLVLRLKGLWQQLEKDILQGSRPAVCAARFHNTIVDFTLAMCDNLRLKTGTKTVALSGGVFQNRLLLNTVREELKRAGFKVLTHRQVPSNDGGLALGQLILANLKSK